MSIDDIIRIMSGKRELNSESEKQGSSDPVNGSEKVYLKKLKSSQIPEELKNWLDNINKSIKKEKLVRALEILQFASATYVVLNEFSYCEEEGFPVYEDEDIYCRFLKTRFSWRYECFKKIREPLK